MSAARKALICFWEGYLGVAPSLVNAAMALADRGWRVEILTLEQGSDFAPPPDFPPAVRVRTLKAFARTKRIAALKGPVGSAVRATAAAADFASATGAAQRLAQRLQPDLIVGVDPHGLALAAAAKRQAPMAKLAYWSLEITRLEQLRNPIDRWAKRSERRNARGADVAVIQDPQRGELLLGELGEHAPRLAFVPNTPRGSAPPSVDGFLQRRLGLASDTPILLHAGAVNDAMMAPQLADLARVLPEPWRLVLHERERRDPDDPYLQALQVRAHGRLVLSLDPVPLDQVDRVFASARIGVVAYADTLGGNYSEIAFASGKLGYFLRNGAPLIVNGLPSLMELVDEAGCGLAVDALTDAPAAVAAIDEDYARYSEAARRFFEERLEFDGHFERALGGLL